MNIVVCVKQVPDTRRVKFDQASWTMIREGVPGIVNPADKNALEEALRIKDRLGGAVIALSMGPERAADALREALGMGADRAILLCDQAFSGADALVTSRVLAAAIRRLEWDIVLVGDRSADGDTALVGPELAERLGIPQVTGVSRTDPEGDLIRVRRSTDEGCEEVLVRRPALLSVAKGRNDPRYVRMGRIFALDRPPVEIWTALDLSIDANDTGLAGSPTRVLSCQAREAKRDGIVLRSTAEDSADRIARALWARLLL